jgi:hypothetical protein
VSVEEAVIARIQGLVQEAQSLKVGNQHNQAFSQNHIDKCAGWKTSAINCVQFIISNPENIYRKRAEETGAKPNGYSVNQQVGELASVLANLADDIERGLLASIADRARAEPFDDFLDHAKDYHAKRKKSESGVIAGVVFEDSLRRVCRKHGVEEKGQKLDSIISELAKRCILSQSKAKRARAAADLRTKATHAQWDEFDLPDVQAAISFTEELVASQLDS